MPQSSNNTSSNTALMQTDKKLWKKKAALFLISQNISLFGSAVAGFSIVWHITLQTTSGIWMMFAALAFTVPQMCMSLWGGVWADRYNRKYLIAISDGFIALITLCLAIAFQSGITSLFLLLAALACRALGGGVQAPAVNALFPQLVPANQLTKVQGLNQSINAVLMILAPAAGGALLGTVGLVGAFMVDVITATIAIIILLFIKIERIPTKKKILSTFTEMHHGLIYTFTHPQLKFLAICYVLFFFLITPAAILTPLLIARTFGEEVWRLTASEVAWSGASVLGGLFVSFYGNFKNKLRVLTLCMIFFGIVFNGMGLAPNFILFLIPVSIGGFFLPIFTTVETVFIQRVTAPEKLGRVFSIFQIISTSAMPIAIIVFGPLADYVSVQSILICCGLTLSITGIYCRKLSKKLENV